MVPQFGKAESEIFHVKYSILRYMIDNVIKALRFTKWTMYLKALGLQKPNEHIFVMSRNG